MVAISGPAGIGKTTIARALYNRLSSSFQLTCFVDNLRGIYRSGFDEYGLKLHLQEQFLSKVLNHNGMRICHLGAIKENLCDLKVLIILDDVNHLKQLEALAGDISWFGLGSRIVVTTENKELLQQHGINNTYPVGFPTSEQALKILCRFAFRKSYPHDGINNTYPVGFPTSEQALKILCRYAFTQSSPNYGFNKFFVRIIELCGNLPLALRVVGSLLCGKEEDEWEDVVNRLETILDRDIEDVLRVGYDSLDENEQTLFLHIAVFFNRKYSDLVEAMFRDGNLDVKRGLKILVYKSLISIDGKRIKMHRLLQQMAIKANRKQEPWKRQILMDAHEICHVFENEIDTSAVSGISFDISGINELILSKRVFKRMSNLQYLSFYKSRDDGNDTLFIKPEEMEFPRRLRLLRWMAYPRKCLPPTFLPEYLVKLDMRHSKLQYLWQGVWELKNLKKMNLARSYQLKELPDLSNATNLEKLDLRHCKSLVEIPSSFQYLQKLKELRMRNCINLQVTPPDLKLPSLERIGLTRCSKLRNFPFISTNFEYVDISETSFEEVPPSVMLSSRLSRLITRCGNVKGITHLPTSLRCLDLTYSSIERIPDCIKALHRLQLLSLYGCRRLASLPELPVSLEFLIAADCESLETVYYPLNHIPNAGLVFINCFKLGEQARQEIIQSSLFCQMVILPGREIPAEFEHRATGNSLTIRLDGNNRFSRFKLCAVVSLNHQISQCREDKVELLCRRIGIDTVEEVFFLGNVSEYRAEHLVILDSRSSFDPSEVSREIMFEFSCKSQGSDIIECGAHVWTDETIKGNYESGLDQVFEHSEAFEDDTNGIVICDEILEGQERTDCWSWLFLCFNCLPFCEKHQ